MWNDGVDDVPDPFADSLSLLSDDSELLTDRTAETGAWFADEINKSISGYRGRLSFKEEINILILDAATPGRMSVQYFRNMQKEMYLNRLQYWHTHFVWKHSYRSNKDKRHISFIGAPSIIDIAKAAYGEKRR